MIQTGKISIGTTPTEICTTDQLMDVVVRNLGNTGAISVGDDSVSLSDGLGLSSGTIVLPLFGTLYGIAAEPTQLEFYLSHGVA